MLLTRGAALALILSVFCTPFAAAQATSGGVRVTFSFAAQTACEIELTGDSVRVRRDNPFAPHPVGFAKDTLELGRRALTSGERDSAELLLGLAHRWKGYKRYACPNDDGYGYSLWTDSLLLNCRNCYSCTDGIGMGEARMLEKFGRYTLWLYRMKDEWLK